MKQDIIPVASVVLGSLVLAMLLYVDMNGRPLFETFWMASLFIGDAAVRPQLWMTTRTGGCTAGLTFHHVATVAFFE